MLSELDSPRALGWSNELGIPKLFCNQHQLTSRLMGVCYKRCAGSSVTYTCAKYSRRRATMRAGQCSMAVQELCRIL